MALPPDELLADDEEPTPTIMISLRVPTDLRKRLQARARRNHRTLTGEILYLLERALDQEPDPAARAPGRS